MNETKKDGFPFVTLAIVIVIFAFFAFMTNQDIPQEPNSLYVQAVENCPNGWEINRFCTEKIYNYSCRNDGQNITYIC